MTPEKITCTICRCRFNVAPPNAHERDNRTICSVPGCRRPFWHGQTANKLATMNIDPQRLNEWGFNNG